MNAARVSCVWVCSMSHSALLWLDGSFRDGRGGGEGGGHGGGGALTSISLLHSHAYLYAATHCQTRASSSFIRAARRTAKEESCQRKDSWLQMFDLKWRQQDLKLFGMSHVACWWVPFTVYCRLIQWTDQQPVCFLIVASVLCPINRFHKDIIQPSANQV